jgi:hypothetical protein
MGFDDTRNWIRDMDRIKIVVRQLNLSLPVVASVLSALLPVVATSAYGEDSQDFTYKVSGAVFALSVSEKDQVNVSNGKPASIILPNAAPGKRESMEGLSRAWTEYYSGFLNGRRDILKEFAFDGVVPTIPSRLSGQKADLQILTMSDRGGSVRVILHWKLFQTEHSTSEFYDCQIWTENDSGEWRVKSMLFED